MAFIFSCERTTRESNPQPIAGQLISNQPARHSLILPFDKHLPRKLAERSGSRKPLSRGLPSIGLRYETWYRDLFKAGKPERARIGCRLHVVADFGRHGLAHYLAARFLPGNCRCALWPAWFRTLRRRRSAFSFQGYRDKVRP